MPRLCVYVFPRKSSSSNPATQFTSVYYVLPLIEHNTRHALDRAERKTSGASSAPAKSKASLSACGPEKLRATVIEARLMCKTLEAKLELLRSKINEEGVDVSESLENDLLKIIGGGGGEYGNYMYTTHEFLLERADKAFAGKKNG